MVDRTEISSPYVGLAPFDASHREYFFGRRLDAQVLADNILARPIVVLYGGSGVGKSSVLNVGLPKALIAVDIASRIAFQSAWHEPHTAVEWLHNVTAPPPSSSARNLLLLVLDQFEEFFLYAAATQVRELGRSLAMALRRSDIEAHILIALRDDGLHRLDALRGELPPILDTTLELRHLDDDAVREAIEGPIRVWNRQHDTNVTIEPDFANTLISDLRPRDVDGNPRPDGRIELAYLQLALQKIWEAEGGRVALALRTSTLTRRLQGMAEISRRHVSEVLGQLPDDDQALCATVFDRLVTPSGGKILYASADLASIAKVPVDRMDAVLGPLSTGAARLLRAVDIPGRRHAKGYEILHDVLARPVLQWRETWLTRLERARTEAVDRQRRRLLSLRNRLVLAIALLAILSTVATVSFITASRASKRETQARVRETVQRLIAEGERGLAERGGLLDERALLQLSAANRLWPSARSTGGLFSGLTARAGLIRLWRTPRDTSLAQFTPDGQQLMSVGRMGEVRFWNTSSGKLTRDQVVTQGVSAGTVIGLGSRGQLELASADSAMLWDVSAKRFIAGPFKCEGRPLISVTASDDAAWLAAGNDAGTICIWNVQTKHAAMARQVHDGWGYPADVIAFDPGGGRLASTYGNWVAVWNLQGRLLTDSFRLTPERHLGGINTLVWAPDGASIAVGDADGDLTIGTLKATHWLTTKWQADRSELTRIAFSPDGHQVASASKSGTVQLWDRDGTPASPAFSGHNGEVRSLAYSPDGRQLASVGDDSIRLWDAKIWAPLVPNVGISLDLEIAVNKTGDRLASSPFVTIWNGHTGQDVGLVTRLLATDVVFHPIGRHVAVADPRNGIQVWDSRDGEPIGPPFGASDEPISLAFSIDGRQIITGCKDGRVRRWDATTHLLAGSSDKLAQASVISVEPTSDGRFVVFVGLNGSIGLLDADTLRQRGSLIQTHKELRKPVSGPDGRSIALLVDGAIQLWTIADGRLFEKQTFDVRQTVAALWAPDGRTILSADEDWVMHLWDANTGQTVGRALAPGDVFPALRRGLPATVRGALLDAAISGDGRYLFFAGRAIRQWPGPTVWPDEICAKVTRNMSQREWREWVSRDIEYVPQCPALPVPSDDLDSFNRSAR